MIRKLTSTQRSQFVVVFTCIISIIGNFLIQGITCNDEVQLRLWGQQGLGTFLENQIIKEGVQKGRVLGFLGNVKFLGYISDNVYVFRGIEILFLLAAVGLMGVFTFGILGNSRFSIVLCVVILAFIPITFEPAVPNAFIIVITQPLILLLLSLILWLNYLDKPRKYSTLAFSLFFFFWAMCLYEFVVTYVLLFPIIYLLKSWKSSDQIILKNIYKACKKCFPVFAVTCIYLATYFIQRIFALSSYSGNQISITSISAVIKVIVAQCISAFPGYYLINEKYRYLFDIYADTSLLNIVSIAVFITTFLHILYSNFCFRSNNRQFSPAKKKLILVTAFAYTLIPTLPNSITSLYQEAVATGNFLSIPVSLYLYFAMMFFLTYLIWETLRLFQKKALIYAVTLIMVFIATNVQVHNRVFAKVQEADYNRFTKIEHLLESDYWNQFTNSNVYAPSLFETRNALAIEDAHWTSYSLLCQHTLNIFAQQPVEQTTNLINLEMQEDGSFYLYSDGYLNVYINSNEKDLEDSLQVLTDVDKKTYVFIVNECIWQWKDLKFYTVKPYDEE